MPQTPAAAPTAEATTAAPTQSATPASVPTIPGYRPGEIPPIPLFSVPAIDVFASNADKAVIQAASTSRASVPGMTISPTKCDGTGSYSDDKLPIQNNGDGTATVNGMTAKDAPKVEKVAKLGKFPPVESLKPVEPCGTVITLENGVLFDFGKSDASGAFTIDESNAHVEIPAGTKTVVINGSNNHIVGEAVSEITINGSANAVEVKSADKVSFTGSNNAIQYKDGNAPQVGTDSGANNIVSKG